MERSSEEAEESTTTTVPSEFTRNVAGIPLYLRATNGVHAVPLPVFHLVNPLLRWMPQVGSNLVSHANRIMQIFERGNIQKEMLRRIVLSLTLLGIELSLEKSSFDGNNLHSLEVGIQLGHSVCGQNRRLLQSFNRSMSEPPGSSPSPGKHFPSVLLTIAAAVSGFFVVVICTALVVLFAMWPKKLIMHFRNKRRRAPEERVVVPLRTTEDCVSLDPELPRISMHDLVVATNNFDKNRVIGDGGFGLVYKADLSNGRVVAVKKLSMDACQGIREFQAETETLGLIRIRHKNLVEILGYCKSGQERLLIYSFMENGSLDEWLHEREDMSRQLDWEKRLKIIGGVAEGLSFLHHECKPHVIHRDIKGSNILLDNSFQAHITDFGLARNMNPQASHISTQAAGTLGYMPPEYASGSIASIKGDVYSFGMLMLEVATGRRPNLHIKDRNARTLRCWVLTMMGEERLMELLDASLRESLVSRQHSQEEVTEFLKIALLCTEIDPQERPLMQDVVVMLKSIIPEDIV